MKYTHKFNSRLTCTIEIADRRVEPGEHHVIKTSWSERPKKKHAAEYVRWMHMINDRYAKQFDMRIMHLFQLSPKFSDWQLWEYSPEAPPQRVEMPYIPGGPANFDELDKLNKALTADTPASMIYDHQTEEKP
jgi:hypothetical protein